MTLSAAIFDLDGTLIDSERVYQASDREFLSGYGIELTDEESSEFIGLDSREIVRRLMENYGIPGNHEDVLAEKNRMFLELAVGQVRAFPTIYHLAERLAELGFGLAIATATPVPIREEMVRLCDLEGLFPVRVSADEVERSKPAPDVYIEAARRLGVPPEACVVLEDSQYGIRGARSAGMRVVAVPTDIMSAVLADVDFLIPGGPANLDVGEALAWIRAAGRDDDG